MLYEQQLQQAMELSRVDTPPTSSTTNGFLTDRARLEQERLQRQSKRTRTDDGPSSGSSRVSEPVAKRPNVASGSIPADTPDATIREEMFWDGEYRPIANQFCNPRKDRKLTFRLTEVLGKVSRLEIDKQKVL